MANLSGFNAESIEPTQDFTLLPAGDYKVIVKSTERKETKAGTGAYLKLEIEVIEGPNKGGLIFENLNLWNPNETAVKIAQQSLSSLCRAAGNMTPGDSSELCGIPICATVKINKGSGDYGPSNGIRSYKPLADCKCDSVPASADVPATQAKAPWDV